MQTGEVSGQRQPQSGSRCQRRRKAVDPHECGYGDSLLITEIQAPEIATIGQPKPEECGPETWSMRTNSVHRVNAHRDLLLYPAIGVAAVPNRR